MSLTQQFHHHTRKCSSSAVWIKANHDLKRHKIIPILQKNKQANEPRLVLLIRWTESSARATMIRRETKPFKTHQSWGIYTTLTTNSQTTSSIVDGLRLVAMLPWNQPSAWITNWCLCLMRHLFHQSDPGRHKNTSFLTQRNAVRPGCCG